MSTPEERIARAREVWGRKNSWQEVLQAFCLAADDLFAAVDERDALKAWKDGTGECLALRARIAELERALAMALDKLTQEEKQSGNTDT